MVRTPLKCVRKEEFLNQYNKDRQGDNDNLPQTCLDGKILYIVNAWFVSSSPNMNRAPIAVKECGSAIAKNITFAQSIINCH
jgi:hypothetical protein